jgi:hypothetical protein
MTRSEARGDWTDDEQVDVVMDNAYLRTTLELDDPQNRFSCFPPLRHASFCNFGIRRDTNIATVYMYKFDQIEHAMSKMLDNMK